MGTSAVSPAKSLVDFIMEHATAEAILSFELPDAERERAIELLDKQDEDALTAEEASELQQMLLVEGILLSLKARAIRAKG